jgi:hypothetical protein
MAAISLSDDIGCEGADGVDGEFVSRQGGETSHRLQRSLEDDEGGWAERLNVEAKL